MGGLVRLSQLRLVAAIMLGLLLASALAFGSNDPDSSLLAVRTAWESRQQRVQAFRFVCSQQRIYPLGTLLNPTFPKSKNPDGKNLPTETSTFDASFTLLVDGDTMRFVRDTIGIAFGKEVKRNRFTSVSNGKDNKKYYPIGTVDYPEGIIGPEKVNPDDVRDSTLLPLLLLYRPFVRAFGQCGGSEFIESFRIVPEMAVLGNRRCLVLKENSPSPAVRSLWIDPARQFIVLRYTMSMRGKTIYQLDYEAFDRVREEWVPRAWKETILDIDGALHHSVTTKVEEADINATVDAAEFEIEFPPGTFVIDRRSPTSPGLYLRYIIRENGEKRVITPEEDGATYEQLVQSASGMGLTVPRSRSTMTWWVSVLIVSIGAVLVIALVAWRRHRREAAP